MLPCEQRLHFRGMSYFSHASSYRENVASARRVAYVDSNLEVMTNHSMSSLLQSVTSVITNCDSLCY